MTSLIERALAVFEKDLDRAEAQVMERWRAHMKKVGLKHGGTSHDQSSHGNWATGSGSGSGEVYEFGKGTPAPRGSMAKDTMLSHRLVARVNDLMAESVGGYESEDFMDIELYGDLQNTSDATRGIVKGSVVKNLLGRMEAMEDMEDLEPDIEDWQVNDAIGLWAQTANDNQPAAMQLQEAAAKEFKVPLSHWQTQRSSKNLREAKAFIDQRKKERQDLHPASSSNPVNPLLNQAELSAWQEEYDAHMNSQPKYQPSQVTTDWLGTDPPDPDYPAKRAAWEKRWAELHSSEPHEIANPEYQNRIVQMRHHQAGTEAEFASRWPGLSYGKVRVTEFAPSPFTQQIEDEAFVRAMYQNTQETLNNLRFSPDNRVTLYRGVGGDALQNATGDVVEGRLGQVVGYRGNVLESWSLSPNVAREFASNLIGGTGAVIAMRVPISNIVSTYATGTGCLTEEEVIVLGSVAGQTARLAGMYQESPSGGTYFYWAKEWEERIAEVKHLMGQHDQDTHGSWATGSGFDVEPMHHKDHLNQGREWKVPEDGRVSLYHSTRADPKSIVEKGLLAGPNNSVYAHQAPNKPELSFYKYTVEFERNLDENEAYPAGSIRYARPAYENPHLNTYRTDFDYYGVWISYVDVPPADIKRIRDDETGQFIYDRDKGGWLSVKHQPGQHNQKTHGSWARGGTDGLSPLSGTGMDRAQFTNDYDSMKSTFNQTALRGKTLNKLNAYYDELMVGKVLQAEGRLLTQSIEKVTNHRLRTESIKRSSIMRRDLLDNYFVNYGLLSTIDNEFEEFYSPPWHFDGDWDDEYQLEVARNVLEHNKDSFVSIAKNKYPNSIGYRDREMIKHSNVTEVAEEADLDYATVNKVIGGWAVTSNHSSRSLQPAALQQAAADEFGVNLSPWQETQSYQELSEAREYYLELQSKTSYTYFERDRLTTEEARAKYKERYPNPNFPTRFDPKDPTKEATLAENRKIVRAMYTETQEALAAQGYKPNDTVTLYRGVGLPVAQDHELGSSVAYKGNAIESWSFDVNQAAKFAEHRQDKNDPTNPNPFLNSTGYLLAAEVPVRSILSLATTGFGCFEENEIVIFGSITGSKVYIRGKNTGDGPKYAFLKSRIIIPIKHLPGQHDQSSHGSWARGQGNDWNQVISRFTETGYSGSSEARAKLKELKTKHIKGTLIAAHFKQVQKLETQAITVYDEWQAAERLHQTLKGELDFHNRKPAIAKRDGQPWGEAESAAWGERNDTLKTAHQKAWDESYDKSDEYWELLRQTHEQREFMVQQRALHSMSTRSTVLGHSVGGREDAEYVDLLFSDPNMNPTGRMVAETNINDSMGSISGSVVNPEPQHYFARVHRLLEPSEVDQLLAAGVPLGEHTGGHREGILGDFGRQRMTAEQVKSNWGSDPTHPITGKPIRRDSVSVSAEVMTSRSHFDDKGPEIWITPDDMGSRGTTAHELGHWLEYRNPKVAFIGQEFLRRRTQGEDPVTLRSLGNKPRWEGKRPPGGYDHFRANEYTQPDDFFTAYVGKAYDDYHTEVVSTGLEHFMVDGGVQIALEDREHWLLIYDIIQGNI